MKYFGHSKQNRTELTTLVPTVYAAMLLKKKKIMTDNI